jgi:hypothetical protein
MKGFTFEVVDKAVSATERWARLRSMVHKLKTEKNQVKAGVLGEQASATHGDGPATNAEIAAYMEYGTETIPARSFIMAPFTAHRKEYLAGLEKMLPQVIDGKTTVEKALGIVGLKMVSDMKHAILDGAGIPPPLAQSTISAKGSTRPLVDTGQLIGSLTFAVETPGKK